VPEHDATTVTRILHRLNDGEANAADQLLPIVWDELRRQAGRLMAGQPAGHSLQPTALVNEAYLKLFRDVPRGWENRGHFLAVAAKAMRSILVDHARAKGSQKRDPDRAAPAEPITAYYEERAIDLLALNEALDDLLVEDSVAAHIVEMRFYAGATVEETAQYLQISVRTVERKWAFARVWLRGRMK